jgi:hypothetical protein
LAFSWSELDAGDARSYRRFDYFFVVVTPVGRRQGRLLPDNAWPMAITSCAVRPMRPLISAASARLGLHAAATRPLNSIVGCEICTALVFVGALDAVPGIGPVKHDGVALFQDEFLVGGQSLTGLAAPRPRDLGRAERPDLNPPGDILILDFPFRRSGLEKQVLF